MDDDNGEIDFREEEEAIYDDPRLQAIDFLPQKVTINIPGANGEIIQKTVIRGPTDPRKRALLKLTRELMSYSDLYSEIGSLSETAQIASSYGDLPDLINLNTKMLAGAIIYKLFAASKLTVAPIAGRVSVLSPDQWHAATKNIFNHMKDKHTSKDREIKLNADLLRYVRLIS